MDDLPTEINSPGWIVSRALRRSSLLENGGFGAYPGMAVYRRPEIVR
jgi:hypothetical protein